METTNGISQEADEVANHVHPTFREALWVWCRVAMLSFGGPAGQIAVLHRILVEEKRWVSENRFLHALNYCMLLPGQTAAHKKLKQATVTDEITKDHAFVPTSPLPDESNTDSATVFNRYQRWKESCCHQG